MNWNPFKKPPQGPDLEVARHESLLTAVANAHNQVVDTQAKLDALKAQLDTASKDMQDQLAAFEKKTFRMVTALDEAMAGEVVKSAEDLKVWLRKELRVLVDVVQAASGEKHLLYDVQVHESDDRVVDVRVHGDPNNPWGASDSRPPYRIESRHLTVEEAKGLLEVKK